MRLVIKINIISLLLSVTGDKEMLNYADPCGERLHSAFRPRLPNLFVVIIIDSNLFTSQSQGRRRRMKGRSGPGTTTFKLIRNLLVPVVFVIIYHQQQFRFG